MKPQALPNSIVGLVFDIVCTGKNSKRFIVELQKAKQNFFKDRNIFYATFPIREQAERGDHRNFELAAVYCVGIMDFVFEVAPLRLLTYREGSVKNASVFEEVLFCFLKFDHKSLTVFTRAGNIEHCPTIELGNICGFVFGVFEIANTVLR